MIVSYMGCLGKKTSLIWGGGGIPGSVHLFLNTCPIICPFFSLRCQAKCLVNKMGISVVVSFVRLLFFSLNIIRVLWLLYNGQWVERPTLLHVYSSYFCFELNITKLTITWLWRLDFSSFLLIVKFLLHNDKDASTFSHFDAKDWYLTSAGLRLACKKGFINHFSITDSQ